MSQKSQVELRKIAAGIRAALIEVQSGSIFVARGILRAKGLHPNVLDWLTWCHAELGIGRRSAFMYARVASWLEQIEDVLVKAGLLPGAETGRVQQCCTVDITALEALSAIPVDRLPAFLKSNRVADMDRDELRAAVNAFLGRESRETAQLDFFARLKLPPPNDLLALLRKSETVVSIGKAASYGCIFLDAVVARRAQLQPKQRKDLIENLTHLLEEVTELNVGDVIRKLAGQ